MAIGVTNFDFAVTELLTPAPNGTITVFYPSQPFRAGTVQVWRNGMLCVAMDPVNGYAELNGDSIMMMTAPATGDTLQAQYEAL